MISIRDEHLERQIDRERCRRGDATQAKTLSDLARERIVQLEEEGVYDIVERHSSPERQAS